MKSGRIETAVGKAHRDGVAGPRTEAAAGRPGGPGRPRTSNTPERSCTPETPRTSGRPRRWPLGAACLAAALLAACGSSPPIRYHALSAVAVPAGAGVAYDGPVLEVGPVQLPPALGRPELVRDTAAGRFEVREFDHWAAPLPRLARQALAEDLEARLPPGKVVYPGASWPPPGAVLEVDVLSFRATGGVATIAASWSVRPRPAAGGAPAASGVRGAQLRLEVPAPDGGPEATTQAWNALLGQLADRVVADLAGTAPAR